MACSQKRQRQRQSQGGGQTAKVLKMLQGISSVLLDCISLQVNGFDVHMVVSFGEVIYIFHICKFYYKIQCIYKHVYK